MEPLANLGLGFETALSPWNLLYAFVGVVLGLEARASHRLLVPPVHGGDGPRPYVRSRRLPHATFRPSAWPASTSSSRITVAHITSPRLSP